MNYNLSTILPVEIQYLCFWPTCTGTSRLDAVIFLGECQKTSRRDSNQKPHHRKGAVQK